LNCRVSVDISALRLYRQNFLDCCRPSCVREPRLWTYLQRVDWLSLRSKTRRYQLLRGLAGPSYWKGPPERLLSTCQHFDLPNTLISLSSHLYWFQALFSGHSVRRLITAFPWPVALHSPLVYAKIVIVPPVGISCLVYFYSRCTGWFSDVRLKTHGMRENRKS
jgi:hypothetical protein